MNDGETPEQFHKRRAELQRRGINGNGAETPLAIAAKQWPTIRSTDGGDNLQTHWATPHANATTGVGSDGRDGGDNLQTQAYLFGLPVQETETPGNESLIDFQNSPQQCIERQHRLNPLFVAWLMGYLVPTNCGPTEMQSYLKQRRLLLFRWLQICLGVSE